MKLHNGPRGGRFADAGSETVNLAILMPIALVLLMSIVQVGLWWHAVNLCSTAAQNGADAGRVVSGTGADAQSAASDFLARAGARVVTSPHVQADVSGQHVSVVVSASALRVLPIPGLDIHVQQRAEAAKERFTVPGGRP